MKVCIDGLNAEEDRCYSCGKKITIEEPFIVHFDKGEPKSRTHPGDPATVFLECEKCYERNF